MRRFFSLFFAFVLLSVPVFSAVDGSDVVRPGILTGNIDLNNGSGVMGVPSGVYPAFVINGQTVFLPQTVSDTGKRFIFTDSAYTGASRVCTAYDFVSPTNGYLAFAADQYYRCNVALLGQTSNISSVSVLQVSGFHLVSIDGQSFTFYFDQDTALSSVYWRLSLSSGFELNSSNTKIIGFSFLSFQMLTGFTHSSDCDVVQAIEDQTQHIDDGFKGGLNPDQGRLDGEISGGIADMDSFESDVFADINDYKGQLDFGFGDFAEAGAGLDYIRNVFMMVWNNSPVQPIVLSLMLGVALLLLGRGVAAATSSARENYQADRRAERRALDRDRRR